MLRWNTSPTGSSLTSCRLSFQPSFQGCRDACDLESIPFQRSFTKRVLLLSRWSRLSSEEAKPILKADPSCGYYFWLKDLLQIPLSMMGLYHEAFSNNSRKFLENSRKYLSLSFSRVLLTFLPYIYISLILFNLSVIHYCPLVLRFDSMKLNTQAQAWHTHSSESWCFHLIPELSWAMCVCTLISISPSISPFSSSLPHPFLYFCLLPPWQVFYVFFLFTDKQ